MILSRTIEYIITEALTDLFISDNEKKRRDIIRAAYALNLHDLATKLMREDEVELKLWDEKLLYSWEHYQPESESLTVKQYERIHTEASKILSDGNIHGSLEIADKIGETQYNVLIVLRTEDNFKYYNDDQKVGFYTKTDINS